MSPAPLKRAPFLKGRLLWSALIFLASGLLAETRSQTDSLSRESEGSIDFGQLESGQLDHTDGTGQSFTRTTVSVALARKYAQRLGMRFSLSEMFWYPLPVGQFDEERFVRFESDLEAYGVLIFGNPERPRAFLQFGLFPFKYNPDASDLGEYLYRSGTYPGYLWTGGNSYLNSAYYTGQGIRLNVTSLDGFAVQDFTLFMERDIEPLHDFSPGYVLTLKPAGYLELGGGGVWAHGLSWNPEKLSPHDPRNAYSLATGLPLLDATDTATLNSPANQLGYYTFKGFKLMARVSLDLAELLDQGRLHGKDFKLYSEIALLGVENQPFYYDKRTERMPIMMGIAIPAMGLLDRFSVEAEYHKSRFKNSISYLEDGQLPLPLNGATDNPYNYSDSAVHASPRAFASDDWHWSVFAERKIMDGITLSGLAASDHFRHENEDDEPHSDPATMSWKDWYYVMRLNFRLP
ncbi:MAG: hypothetical protein JF616_05170 [Fibrobacteres bacterium]|nr:hypothetical protein [Fibrobacterota bacterium]